ncbi:hypothetical protein DYB32_007726 [Aphanomyces invadans]|uniref:Uncharacterized protein n=1 Tax=Aphanomyces invadans TaxID=157072 RepID=A0A3R6Z1X8_9STRA|nr:hypothetical protein DYB32_007726 [Aphanomyces invadans]
MDAAELLDSYTDAIYASTYTAEEVVALKERKKMNETIMLCRAMLRDETWEHDATVNELDVYLTYASTLESLTRRYEAIDILVRGIDIMDEHPMLRLALARLQFKAGLYEEALESCLLVAEAYPNDTRCSKESAADAYHLAGGGTWFEALGHVVDADVGHAVAFAGPLRHGGASVDSHACLCRKPHDVMSWVGHAITSGCRLILVLFLYVDGFAYGDYLANFAEDNDTNNAGAGKGFVVYNQTVELVATLNEAPPATVTCQGADDA